MPCKMETNEVTETKKAAAFLGTYPNREGWLLYRANMLVLNEKQWIKVGVCVCVCMYRLV